MLTCVWLRVNLSHIPLMQLLLGEIYISSQQLIYHSHWAVRFGFLVMLSVLVAATLFWFQISSSAQCPLITTICVKVKLSLCVPWSHVLRWGIAPNSLNFGRSFMRIMSFTLSSFEPQKRASSYLLNCHCYTFYFKIWRPSCTDKLWLNIAMVL